GEELLEALHAVTVAATAAAPYDELTRVLEEIYELEATMPAGHTRPAGPDPAATVVLSREELMSAAVQRGARVAVLSAADRPRPTRPRVPRQRARR
ncbi:MAG TPA: hypothetical protein VFR35_17400, partial [Actinoplanes sp.]|nr:hypothetical protein [Actinoplanes sp.]